MSPRQNKKTESATTLQLNYKTKMTATTTKFDSTVALKDYDILVVGKSGNGKSAVCNTLLGQEKFTLGRSMTTTTTTVQHATRSFNNMRIRIIDTPDITNCGLDSVDARRAEVSKWKKLLISQYPPMVLLTVRCDVRYTSEEMAVYREIQRCWGLESLDTSLVVAFTFGDRQDYDIEEDVKDPPPELGQVLQRAEKRFLVFVNKDTADRPVQASKCFSMLETLPESESVCPYSCAIV